MRVDVWASVLTMLLGFVIIVFALGGRSFSNPYKSWSERLIVVAVCALAIGILHCVTSVQSLRHLTPSALGSTIAWFIAVSDVSSYLRYRRCNFNVNNRTDQ